MANVEGATFMQMQEKCGDCPDVHWLNSYYVFIPKIGPLRFGYNHRGTYAVQIEDTTNLTWAEIDRKLKQFGVQDIEYGVCSGCQRDRQHMLFLAY